MIELVLHDPREQAVEIEVDRIPSERPGIDHDPLRSAHVHPHAGEAEAALVLHGGAARP